MKIVSTLQWSLLAAATILNGILAGGSLIKSVVELPARRAIGLPAMAAYHRAADLHTGLWVYLALGLAAPALTIALGMAFVIDHAPPVTGASFVYLAAALSLAHISRRPGRPRTCSSSALGCPKRRSSQRCTAHLPDGRR